MCKDIFQASGQSETADAGIRNDQDMVAFVLFDDIRNCFDTADNFWFAVWKKRKRCLQYRLKGTAIDFFNFFMACNILSGNFLVFRSR